MAKEEIEDDFDFLGGEDRKGFEQIEAGDLKTPYLTILQSLSPVCVRSKPEFIKEARPGMFYNTLTKEFPGKHTFDDKENIVSDEITVTVLKRSKKWFEYTSKRGDFVAIHNPNSIEVDQSDYGDWKAANGHSIVETVLFYLLIEGREKEGPVVFTQSKTALKYAKDWFNSLMMQKTPSGNPASIFARKWSLNTALNRNEDGDWYAIGSGKSATVTPGNFIDRAYFQTYVEPNMQLVEALGNSGAQLKAIASVTAEDQAKSEF